MDAFFNFVFWGNTVKTWLVAVLEKTIVPHNITTIITGLGVGGIAIALAAQAILGDLFSYLVIFFDKPFEIGDFIIVEDKMGSIEYIGIKTTRIRTLSGEQLICSNSKLTSSWVHNYKRMDLRRIVFSFGLTFQTPVEKVKAVPGWVKSAIVSKDKTRFDRAHFLKFGESSLDFEVVYYVLDADYNVYMDIQQVINLEIMERFEKEKVEFAYPARTLFFQNPENGNEADKKTDPRSISAGNVKVWLERMA